MYELSFGTVVGVCTGVFIKKGIKALAFLLGAAFVVLQVRCSLQGGNDLMLIFISIWAQSRCCAWTGRVWNADSRTRFTQRILQENDERLQLLLFGEL